MVDFQTPFTKAHVYGIFKNFRPPFIKTQAITQEWVPLKHKKSDFCYITSCKECINPALFVPDDDDDDDDIFSNSLTIYRIQINQKSLQ